MTLDSGYSVGLRLKRRLITDSISDLLLVSAHCDVDRPDTYGYAWSLVTAHKEMRVRRLETVHASGMRHARSPPASRPPKPSLRAAAVRWGCPLVMPRRRPCWPTCTSSYTPHNPAAPARQPHHARMRTPARECRKMWDPLRLRPHSRQEGGERDGARRAWCLVYPE